MQKRFKIPSSITTLLFLSVLIGILTFIIPAGQYQYENNVPIAGSYKHIEQNPQGLWDILSAPIAGFQGAIEVILFVLVLGGCLGIIFETKAIDAALSSITRKLQGREKLMIPILMILCSIGGTSYGMAEETIAFYPIIMPILLAAGYDVITGIMVIFLGAGVGIAGGLINPFSVGIASSLAGISLADEMLVRFILYICYLTFAIIFVMRYAERVRKNPQSSVVYDIKEKTESSFRKNTSDEQIEFTPRRKLAIGIFGAIFVIMILGIIPWNDKFNITIFEDLHHFIKEFLS